MIIDQVSDAQEIEQRTFMTKVYGWMTLGLTISAFCAYFVANNESLANAIIGNRLIFYGLLIAELVAVIAFVGLLKRISAMQALMLFLTYSVLTGLTLSVIFFVYTIASIMTVFLMTACMFGAMSIYGYTTKQDLTTVGNLCLMGLIGLIIASVINLFLHNDMTTLVLSWVGVLIFVGLTAYDTQKIKKMNIIGNAGTDEDRKEAISGALTLYLDFINLFLNLLRIFGKTR